MDNVNQQLYSLWGHEIESYRFDLVSRSIHFQLIAKYKNGEIIRTQIDVEKIRMFCFGDIFCCSKENDFPTPPDGTWAEFTEIEAYNSGQANVKVYFNYSHSKEAPSPYLDVEQNLVIEIVDAILTVSAERIVINGDRFIWNQEAGAFLREE